MSFFYHFYSWRAYLVKIWHLNQVDYMFDRTQGRHPEEGGSEENGTREEEEEVERSERACGWVESQFS